MFDSTRHGPSELQELCEQVGMLAKKTGAFIREESRSFGKSAIAYKAHNNLVSYVDVTAEEQLVAGLQALLPEAAVLAEEGTEKKGTSSGAYRWVIDPLDGTTNFSHALPVYAVSIALMSGDDILIGVVYEINRNELFSAWKGGGAWLNGGRIQVSATASLDVALIGTGFPYYQFGKTDAYLSILKAFMQKTHGVRRLGSAAVDLCYVACGRFEGFFEYNLQPWDVAAGILLVREAGGQVTDFSGGQKPLGEETVAAGPVHQHMIDVIRPHWG